MVRNLLVLGSLKEKNVKTWLVSLLIILVVVATVVLVNWKTTASTPPPEVLAREVTRIDIETGELITLPASEWIEQGEKDGLYKNPKTGKYTTDGIVICESCGKKISLRKSKEGCPKCGKPASSGG